MVTCSVIVPGAASRSSCATPGAGTADRPIATRAPFVQLSIITAHRTWQKASQDMRRLARLSSSGQARPYIPRGRAISKWSSRHRIRAGRELRHPGARSAHAAAHPRARLRQRGAGAKSFRIRYRPLSLRWQFGRDPRPCPSNRRSIRSKVVAHVCRDAGSGSVLAIEADCLCPLRAGGAGVDRRLQGLLVRTLRRLDGSRARRLRCLSHRRAARLARRSRPGLSFRCPAEDADGGRRGATGFMPWTYPPQYDLLLAPFAFLPVGVGYLLFTAATLALYLVTLRAIATAISRRCW